jgi:hypothetical protein
LGEDLKQLKSIIKNGQISLRTIILKQMDVSKIQFLNVVWNSKVHRLGPIKIFERIVILEERLLEVGEKRRDYEAVAHIYWGSDTTMSGIVDMPRGRLLYQQDGDAPPPNRPTTSALERT